MTMMLLLSGMQLLMTGVAGSYLARVFEEVKGRPTWILARSLGASRNRTGRFFRPFQLPPEAELLTITYGDSTSNV